MLHNTPNRKITEIYKSQHKNYESTKTAKELVLTTILGIENLK